MRFLKRSAAPKGSWQWSVRIAEITAWGTIALVLVLLHITNLDDSTYRWGLGASGSAAAWLLILFRILLRRPQPNRWMLWVGLGVNLAFACAIYGLLRTEVPSIALIFIPIVVATSLLGRIPGAVAAPVAALGGFWLVAELTGPSIRTSELALTAGVFLLAGLVAGLLPESYTGTTEPKGRNTDLLPQSAIG